VEYVSWQNEQLKVSKYKLIMYPIYLRALGVYLLIFPLGVSFERKGLFQYLLTFFVISGTELPLSVWEEEVKVFLLWKMALLLILFFFGKMSFRVFGKNHF